MGWQQVAVDLMWLEQVTTDAGQLTLKNLQGQSSKTYPEQERAISIIAYTINIEKSTTPSYITNYPPKT